MPPPVDHTKRLTEVDFTLGGRVVTEAELRSMAPPPARRSSTGGLVRVKQRSQAKYSLGWVVAGFTVERLARAKADAIAAREAAIDHNRRLPGTSSDRVAIPPVWDEQAFMRKAKPTRVRARPYENAKSAELAAELARKGGWVNVTVVEELRA